MKKILRKKNYHILIILLYIFFTTIGWTRIKEGNNPINNSSNHKNRHSQIECVNPKVIIQPGDSSAYAGSKVCQQCHAEYFTQGAHAFTMTDAHKTPERIVAPLTSDSPVQLSQITYTIGAGRGQQRYCDSSFQMLPFRWNVPAKKWDPEPVKDAIANCLSCHSTGYNADTKEWSEFGVTCEACHGPGSLHAATEDKGKILNPGNMSFDQQLMGCVKCHIGKSLSEHAPDSPEGTSCATCHMPGGSHKFIIPLRE